jgi:hypothetical protein
MIPIAAERSPRAWWWRPPAFLCGLGLIMAGLYATGSRIYLTPELASDRAALAEMAQQRALVLGASHGHAVMPSEAGLDGINMSHGGQDLFEMAYIARAVQRRAPKLELVLITLSYFSFVFDNAAYEEHGVKTRIGRRIRLYSGFPRLAFIPGDSAEFMKAKLWPIVTADHYRAAFRRLPLELGAGRGAADDNVDAEETAAAPTRHSHHPHTRGWFTQHARVRCHEYAHLMSVMRKNHPGLENDTRQQLYDLTRELEQAHVRVVFFTPPYQRAYSNCFDARFQRLTREAGAELERSTRARYFDFSTAPDFVDRLDYFANSDHLARDGMIAFSRQLAAALAEKPPR